ncbi:hypothetical protein K9M41_02760, partial [Candidatus Gracilibacteria bacterium]|nr:hypothetical protein [Candidatus Gracilibacteria bacterium]
YFVSTVGINEAIIKKYIEEQGKEDFGQAELELGGSHGSTDPWRPSLVAGFVYFAKDSLVVARDTKRQTAIETISLQIKADNLHVWDNTKYLYEKDESVGKNYNPELEGLKELFRKHKFTPPKGYNNICYFIGMGPGKNGSTGDDNEFVIATWGEETSTNKIGEPGIIVRGTNKAVNAFTSLFSGKLEINEEAFRCRSQDEFKIPRAIFSLIPDIGAPGSRPKFLKLGDKGQIESIEVK